MDYGLPMWGKSKGKRKIFSSYGPGYDNKKSNQASGPGPGYDNKKSNQASGPGPGYDNKKSNQASGPGSWDTDGCPGIWQ